MTLPSSSLINPLFVSLLSTSFANALPPLSLPLSHVFAITLEFFIFKDPISFIHHSLTLGLSKKTIHLLFSTASTLFLFFSFVFFFVFFFFLLGAGPLGLELLFSTGLHVFIIIIIIQKVLLLRFDHDTKFTTKLVIIT